MVIAMPQFWPQDHVPGREQLLQIATELLHKALVAKRGVPKSNLQLAPGQGFEP